MQIASFASAIAFFASPRALETPRLFCADAYAWPLFTFDDTHKSLSACRSLLEDTKPRPRAKREEKRYARVSGWWVAGGHKIEKCNVVVWLRIEILRFLTNRL